MTDAVRPPPFPALNFTNGNNSAISLNVLAEHARTSRVRVHDRGLDGTGKLILAVELPGSNSVKPREFKR